LPGLSRKKSASEYKLCSLFANEYLIFSFFLLIEFCAAASSCFLDLMGLAHLSDKREWKQSRKQGGARGRVCKIGITYPSDKKHVKGNKKSRYHGQKPLITAYKKYLIFVNEKYGEKI
jgi:hypothetical protein